MRFLKHKILWLTIYAITITGVFLYLLFPSDLVRQRLEDAVYASGIILKTGSLRPSMPLGIRLADLTVRQVQSPGDVIFQSETLTFQFNPLSLFQKHRQIHFQGSAYRGNFDGSVGLVSFTQTTAPVEGNINFQEIDLARYQSPAFPLFKGMEGLVRGSAFYFTDGATGPKPVGKLSLYLSRGAYPLPEPFLGVSRIEFDRGEIQAQMKNGIITLEKLEIYGGQMNCLLSGDIQLADRLDESRLNLKGVLEIAGKSKIKMNITVSGTLASPSFRYI